jgi:hypothetical protein
VPIIGTLVMAAAVIAVELGMKSGAHLGDTPTLAACLAVAAVAYLGSLLLMDRSIIGEARGTLVKGL